MVLPQPDGPSRASNSPGAAPGPARRARACRRSCAGCPGTRRRRCRRGEPRRPAAVARRHVLLPTQTCSTAPSGERHGQQERPGHQQAGQRQRDRDARRAASDLDDRDRERVGVQQDPGDDDLAEHQRQRQERRPEHGAADRRQHDPQQCRRHARAEVAGRLHERPQRDRGEPVVHGPVGERQREHDVERSERRRRRGEQGAEDRAAEVGLHERDSGRHHDRRDRRSAGSSRSPAHPARPGSRSRTHTAVGTTSASTTHGGDDGDLQGGEQRRDQHRVAGDREPVREPVPAAGAPAG